MKKVWQLVAAATRKIIYVAGPVCILVVSLLAPATVHASSNPPIFFQSDDGGIYSINSDGSDATSYNQQGNYPSLSPNGQQILYLADDSSTTDCGGAGTEEIYTMNLDGSDATDITGSDGVCSTNTPAWSPDGSKIAFQGDNGNLYVVNSDGTNLEQLPEQGYNPTWSPDGSQIAYVSPQPYGGIEVTNADGSDSTQIVSSGDNPAWAPDGDSIAYTNWNNNVIYTANTDGSNQTAVYSVPYGGGLSEYDGIAWSPDSSTIAFSMYIPNVETTYGIYTVPVTGGSPTQVLAGVYANSEPHAAYSVSWANGSGVPASTLVQAVNAGGSATGNYAADTGFSGGSTFSTSADIDTSGVTNPAPQSVYQSARYGSNFSYTFSGLTPNTNYTLKLDLAEIYWGTSLSGGSGGTGSRVFNVAVNGQSALTNFDIYAAAGGANTAITEAVPATSDSNGNVTVTFTGVVDNAMVNGLELWTGSTPAVTPPTPASSVYVNPGGDASGNFTADEDYADGSTFSTSANIDTSGVTDPAPQSVYQTVRYGSNFTYSISDLAPNSSYNIQLDFAELYWGTSLSGNSGGAGSRVFDVAINGSQVLNDFDIYATAGGANKAVNEDFTATSNANGLITIQFTGVTDNAMVNGIEVTEQ